MLVETNFVRLHYYIIESSNDKCISSVYSYNYFSV